MGAGLATTGGSHTRGVPGPWRTRGRDNAMKHAHACPREVFPKEVLPPPRQATRNLLWELRTRATDTRAMIRATETACSVDRVPESPLEEAARERALLQVGEVTAGCPGT